MGVLCAVLISLFYFYIPTIYFILSVVILVGFYLFLLYFFRNPTRKPAVQFSEITDVIAPADGKIVAIEHVNDDEFIPGEWIQISIFMSPLNVHVNRHPVSGKVTGVAYHPGRYHVAWHPKSSLENERTTIVYEVGNQVLKLRQIAGAVARRIVYYCEEGETVEKGSELGFIKFGSRVDILVPRSSKVTVKIDQKVKGNLDRIAILPSE